MSTGILLGQGGGNSIPTGLICMWSGSSSNIPNEWALCDGSNNTPDLRDKFVLGAGNNYTVGAIGGEKEVTLTIAQMPSHSHDIKIKDSSYYYLMFHSASSNSSSFSALSSSRNQSNVIWNTNTGNDKPHNNMPPYYALCFIMKL